MPDLQGKPTFELLDRLDAIEAELNALPDAVEVAGLASAVDGFARVHELLRETALIHVEITRRAATGWRPM